MDLIEIARNALNWISGACLIFLIVEGYQAFLSFRVYSRTKNKEDLPDLITRIKKWAARKSPGIVIAAVLGYALFIVNILFTFFFPSDQIGALFESSDYKAFYYVHLREGTGDAKFYKLPAEIRREDGKEYYIGKTYWPNGGYLDFEYDQEVLVDEEVEIWCYDDSDNDIYYYVTLTKEKAPDPTQ